MLFGAAVSRLAVCTPSTQLQVERSEMARDAPPSSSRSASPTKRRMAPPTSSNAVWDALELPSVASGSGSEATPRRRLGSAVPGGPRATKSRLKSAVSHEEDLEDGMNLISSFGGLSMFVTGRCSDSPYMNDSLTWFRSKQN